MTTKATRIQQFKAALAAKSAIKVIAGINNFEQDHVLMVAKAANKVEGISAIDISASPDIIQAVRAETSLPLVVSSVRPQDFVTAIELGADVLELGNYDALYQEGLYLTPEDVLKLATDTMTIARGAIVRGQEEDVQENVMVSVTIPGHLSQESQLMLLNRLEEMGVDVIQTEGASRAFSMEPKMIALSAEQKFVLTMANTQLFVSNTSMPIMTASGIDASNAARAFDSGAAAIGVGTAVNQCNDVFSITPCGKNVGLGLTLLFSTLV
jgi:hypothetical protein